MAIELLRTKIHRATVTDADLHYEGSITIDENLLDAAGMYEHEKVQVLNINNGERINTYTISGDEDSGTICLNGAAARKFRPGDKVIILAYTSLPENEVENHSPTIVHVNDQNNVANVQ